MQAERTHALQQAHCVGHGNVQIGLLQTIPQTCIE
jgi:hypothetical protein